jgi:hypothetical protein
MKNPDVEHRIQPLADVGEPSVPSGCIANSPSVENTIQRVEQRQRTVAPGTVFGAFVGMTMGAVTGAACCWLTGLFDFFWHGVLIGTLAGPFAGALIGLKERKARGDLVRADIATLICVVFSLLPALLIGLQGVSAVRGRFSGYSLLGPVFAGPMAGLLIGGILDRAFEAGLKKSWGVALAFAGAGVAICIGILCLIDAAAYGPDPNEVSRETRALITSEWSKNPEVRDAKIHNLTLVRRGRTTYTGFADVTFAGQPGRLILEVLVEGGMLEVSWTVEPLKERGR